MAQQNDPLTAEMQNSLSRLRNQRLDALNAANDVHAALQSAFLNEAQRLEEKLGAENSRSRQLKERVLSNAQVAHALILENELTRVVLPGVADQGALVYGRVADEDNLGIDRLTVRLVSPSYVSLDIGDAITDASGAFAITLDAATIERVLKASPKGIQVAVLSPRGRPLYTQAQPATLTHGAHVLVRIRLLRQDLAAAPVTTGPALTVVVPNVVGKMETEAVVLLKNAQLRLGDRETKISPNQVGQVLAQAPSAGTRVAPDSAIAWTVGITQAETVEVPDVVGSSVRSAASKLKSVGLTLGEIDGMSPTEASIIDRQSPAAGTAARKGATVNVSVRNPTTKG